jgi:hypothetical protein
MPRSRSRAFWSMLMPSSNMPVWRMMASVRVVLPWSTWAMMAILRISIEIKGLNARQAENKSPEGRPGNYTAYGSIRQGAFIAGPDKRKARQGPPAARTCILWGCVDRENVDWLERGGSTPDRYWRFQPMRIPIPQGIGFDSVDARPAMAPSICSVKRSCRDETHRHRETSAGRIVWTLPSLVLRHHSTTF